MRSTGRLTGIIVGMCLLLGTPVTWTFLRDPVTIGTPPSAIVAATAEAPTAATVASGADDAPDRPGDAPVAAAPTPGEPERPPATTALRGAMDPGRWPATVAIAAIGVQAPVRPIGLDVASGALVVPESPMEVGWFQRSAEPGDPGVTLLTSHVDTLTEGRGVFSRLGRLEVGDPIVLSTRDGTLSTWHVVAREQRAKDDLPEALFAGTGSPVLALVTCGGAFDRTTRRYADNIIVWAEPYRG
jgi:hypothetical protein